MPRKNKNTTPGARLAAFFILFVLAMGVSLLYGLAGRLPDDSSRPVPGERIRVKQVYDGDTVKLQTGQKVRLIGIDALDSHNRNRLHEQAARLGMSRADVRKWSRAATRRAKDLVEGKTVRLKYGPEKRDGHGRLLAYVYADNDESGTHLNRHMIVEGLATAMRRFPHPRREEFIQLERRAREGNRGVWKDATRVP